MLPSAVRARQLGGLHDEYVVGACCMSVLEARADGSSTQHGLGQRHLSACEAKKALLEFIPKQESDRPESRIVDIQIFEE